MYWTKASNRNVTLALIILQRRLESSLYAVTRSLQRRRKRLSEELDASLKSKGPSWTAKQASPVEYDPDEDDPEDLTDEDEAALFSASTARTPEELRAEITALEGLITLAEVCRGKGLEKKIMLLSYMYRWEEQVHKGRQEDDQNA